MKTYTKAIVPLTESGIMQVVHTLEAIEADLERLEAFKKQYREQVADYIRKHPSSNGKRELYLGNGAKYVLVQRTTLLVKKRREGAAEKWALESPQTRMKLDAAQALEALKHDSKLIKIFSRNITEFVQLKKQHHETNND